MYFVVRTSLCGRIGGYGVCGYMRVNENKLTGRYALHVRRQQRLASRARDPVLYSDERDIYPGSGVKGARRCSEIPDIACRCTMWSEKPPETESRGARMIAPVEEPSTVALGPTAKASDVKAPNITLISFNKTNNL